MPKWDFNKVAKQLYWNRTSARVFSCNFAAYFQNIFFEEPLWQAASISCMRCGSTYRKVFCRSSHGMFFVQKRVLKIFAKFTENICVRVSFWIKLQAWGLKEPLTQVFSCEFCEILKNTFFYRTPPVATSEVVSNFLKRMYSVKPVPLQSRFEFPRIILIFSMVNKPWKKLILF